MRELARASRGRSVAYVVRLRFASHSHSIGRRDKTGDNRWYETNVPIADKLFERHLKEIEKERAEHG